MRKTSNKELGRLSPEEFASTPKIPVTVVLDSIRSLNNVGSFFRTCDAFAVERLLLCGITGTPPDREIHKTALGAENTVAWEYYTRCTDAVGDLKAAGYETVAVEQAEGSVMLDDFQVGKEEKYALVFGNEVEGVSQEVADLCTSAIEIPQAGTKHSLNVAVCGGVLLWQFFCKYRNRN